MALLVEVIFDYKSHVRKRQIDEVTHYYPVVSFFINSVAVLKPKLYVLLVEVRHLERIAFQFAPKFAIYNVVFFCYEWVSVAILEEESINVDVI